VVAVTPQPNPLDDLRRLGMMTEEVEAYELFLKANVHSFITISPYRVKAKADAALTSVCRKLVEYKVGRKVAYDMMKDAEAEANRLTTQLATVTGRTCGTCEVWDQDCIGEEFGTCDKGHSSEGYGNTTHRDFGCNRYRAKKEEE
jgi:hypothetical protein